MNNSSQTAYINNSLIALLLPLDKAGKPRKSYKELGQNINCTTTLTFEGREGSRVFISPMEISIIDAVYSLYKRGITTFTIGTLAAELAGKPMNFNNIPSDEDALIENVRAGRLSADELCFHSRLVYYIKRLSLTGVSIDCTDVYVRKTGQNISGGKRVIYSGNLLPIETCITVDGGRITDAVYHIIGVPVLYRYAELLQRVIAFNRDLLCSPKVASTPETILLERELIRQIEVMKNPSNHYSSRLIVFEGRAGQVSLFSRIGFSKDNYKNANVVRNKRARLRSKVCQILDDMVGAGYIDGYTIEERNGIPYGVKIELYAHSC